MANPSGMAALRTMVATSAIHNGARDEEDYTGVCHEGTCEEYLKELTTSADNTPVDRRLHWANAIAGAGKTALLRTFCQLLEEKGHSFASFFIWKNDNKRNNLRHFPATIAHQLSRRITALVPHIERAFLQDPLVLESTFENQMLQLIINPLLNAADVVKELHHIIIVVDGLDELNLKAQTQFLNFIPNFISRLSSLPISLLMSSRPEDMIVGAFEHPKLASITRATRIGTSDEDILKFLNDKFDDINLRFPYLRIKYGGKWPSDEQLAIMVGQSSGLFIWPTVVLGHIDKVEKGLRHNERLEQVLSSADPKPWIASPLDNLYRAILEANAPEDRDSFAFLRFKQRLAYLCLPVGLVTFIWEDKMHRVIDWTGTPVRVVFDETLDEFWDSMAGLSSLFSPRPSLSEGKSPTPGISHRSFRDFTFNRARCGDKLFYSSEEELHAKVVCKFLKFFNTRQAFQNCAEMSATFIYFAGEFLISHLKQATVSEELGRCMDDVMLEVIPPTWPLVTQIFAIVRLSDGLYKFAESPEFPERARRRKALLSKLVVFIKSRAETAEEWDMALLRLALSTADFESYHNSHHSVHCWHIARSPQCTCIDAYIRNIALRDYQDGLRNSTLFQHAKSRLLPDGQDVARDSLAFLHFILSLSETSPRANQLPPFVSIRSDCWIHALLKHCPPNDDLYNALVPICTAPLPDFPKREGDESWRLGEQFLVQTEEFNAYTERCRKAGIETKFPPIKIPDDWWEDQRTRNGLLDRGYNPSFDIPGYWWQEWDTQALLLRQGYKPPYEIPDEWWRYVSTKIELLKQGYVQPTLAPPRTGSPMTLSESDSEDAPSHISSSKPQPLPLSPSKPPSITPSLDIDSLPTIIPPQPAAHAIPVPYSASVEQSTASGTSGGQPLGERRRGGGVRAFLKRIFRRR